MSRKLTLVRCSGLPKCGDRTCRHARLHEPEILLVNEVMCTNWCECASLAPGRINGYHGEACLCWEERVTP